MNSNGLTKRDLYLMLADDNGIIPPDWEVMQHHGIANPSSVRSQLGKRERNRVKFHKLADSRWQIVTGHQPATNGASVNMGLLDELAAWFDMGAELLRRVAKEQAK